MHFKLLNFTIVPYKEMLELQHRIVQYKIHNQNFYDILMILEHKPVYTTGKHANFKNLKITHNILKAKH